jgi:hypothetical protein
VEPGNVADEFRSMKCDQIDAVMELAKAGHEKTQSDPNAQRFVSGPFLSANH